MRRSATLRTGLAAAAAGAMIALLPTTATAAPTTTPAPSATASATQVPSNMLGYIRNYENMVNHNPNIVLGARVGDIQCNADVSQCWQVYEHGAIVANANRAVRISDADWQALQAAGGFDVLGYPTSYEMSAPNGGTRQLFTHGEILTPPGSAVAYVVVAPIDTAYNVRVSGHYDGGGPQGPYGYPTSNQTCDASGVCTQTFSGAIAFYSPTTGAAFIPTAAYAVYTDGVTGENPMGLPTSSGWYSYRGYEGQTFQHGHIYVTADRVIYKSYGPIYDRYVALGEAGGEMGEPTGNTTCDLPNNGCYQTFQNGWIFTSPTTGTHIVTGDIEKQFASPEDMAAKVGLPTGEATQKGKTTVQTFEKSTVRITPGTAKHAKK